MSQASAGGQHGGDKFWQPNYYYSVSLNARAERVARRMRHEDVYP